MPTEAGKFDLVCSGITRTDNERLIAFFNHAHKRGEKFYLRHGTLVHPECRFGDGVVKFSNGGATYNVTLPIEVLVQGPAAANGAKAGNGHAAGAAEAMAPPKAPAEPERLLHLAQRYRELAEYSETVASCLDPRQKLIAPPAIGAVSDPGLAARLVDLARRCRELAEFTAVPDMARELERIAAALDDESGLPTRLD